MPDPKESSIAPYVDSEIVLGLVAAVGTDLDDFCNAIETSLSRFRYQVRQVKLSDLADKLASVPVPMVGSPEFVRITRLMNAGNEARKKAPDILALAAAARVNTERKVTGDRREPKTRLAYVFRSLKHPVEVLTLRRIYGPGFFLIGVVNREEDRRSFLTNRKGCKTQEVDALIERDEYEANLLGQRTRDTFHLADVFLRAGDSSALNRFLDLVFKYPYHTPTLDEHAMFLAFSAGLRSADLSRQVGAAIVSDAGDVVGLGANDVPKAGGGLFWPGSDDKRDHRLGYDSNEIRRNTILDRILADIDPTSFLKDKSRVSAVAQETRPDAELSSTKSDNTAEVSKDTKEQGKEKVEDKDKLESRTEALDSNDIVIEEAVEFPPTGNEDGQADPQMADSLGDWRTWAVEKLKENPLNDITEYGRAVHAEMEALLACARSGVSPLRATLFSTTFPCHNCAKHILSAGVARVVYVEPYPKSQAVPMYGESIALERQGHCTDKTVFEAFEGVGPRRFFDLFSMTLSSGYPVQRKKDGQTRAWKEGEAEIRVPLLPSNYIEREATASEKLETLKGGD